MTPKPKPEPAVKFRPHQDAVFRHSNRVLALAWRRQDGKTTAWSAQGMDWMMADPGCTVAFLASSISLGQEMLYREALHWQQFIQQLKTKFGAGVETDVDDDKGQILDLAAVAEQMETKGMEMRFKFDNVLYSRTIVVAPSPNAVGRSGYVIFDECGRARNFTDVHASVKPFISSNRRFNYRLSTTPPLDDTHPCTDLMAPEPGQIFPVKPDGNFYRSPSGLYVHRHDAFDAYAAGQAMFDDDTGEPLSPQQHREKEWDKAAWDRDYGLQWTGKTGLTAITEVDMRHAQSRPESREGVAVAITDELPSSPEGLAVRLRTILPDGFFESLKGQTIGIGMDLASSDGETSNPSALTIAIDRGGVLVTKLVLTWKTRAEQISREIVLFFLARMTGLGIRPRGMAIDASNNALWADFLRKQVVQYCPCECVVNSNTVEVSGRKLNMKQLLGKSYAGLFEDGKISLPSARWLAEDHRLVRFYKDSFDARVTPDGRHADTFDSGKLAQRALGGAGGPAEWNRPDQRSVELGTGMGVGEVLLGA